MLADLLDLFNLIDRAEGFASRVIHSDWKGATGRAGPLGLAAEAARGLSGANDWIFRVVRDSSWTGDDAERFLRHYGVIVWGRRVTGSHFIFSVKGKQANWAEYLLLRRGVTLEGPLFNHDNSRYAARHAPGDQPPAWADRGGSLTNRWPAAGQSPAGPAGGHRPRESAPGSSGADTAGLDRAGDLIDFLAR